MILDANTGQVLHNEDGDVQRHPASLTKMMTLYLAFETIEAGRMSMSDKIKISQEAASVAPSKLELEPGEEITVADAIKAIITKSANDIAVAMAEKVGGSQRNFVALMNAKARELGMSKSHFENASGLPNDAQVTTARDMITLAMRLQDDFPKHYPLFAMREFRYNGSTHRNHNTMLNNFQGIDGVKTGYTQKSGFNLVSSVHRGDKHLIGAVFGGASAATRNGEMRILLTRMLTKASAAKTRKPVLIAKLKSMPKLAERPAAKPKPAAAQQVSEVTPAPRPLAVAKAPAKKLKPAVAPVAVPAPAPVVIATAEAEVSVEAPAAPNATLPPAPAVAAQEPAAAAPLQVFKVKRVMVAPRKSAKLAVPSPAETTDMAPETIEEAAGLDVPPETAASLAAEAAAERETVVTKTKVPRMASALGDKIAMLGATEAGVPLEAATPPAPVTAAAPAAVEAAPAVVTPPAPAAAPAKPAPVNAATAKPARPKVAAANAPVTATAARIPQPAAVQRGAPPSTLQAQAATLSTTATRPQRVASLQPTTGQTAAPKGRFEIQIGAYASNDEAQRNIAAVQSKTGKLLNAYPAITYPVQKAGRQIVRARFRGFDAQSASNTCAELRRQTFDCFVMTAE